MKQYYVYIISSYNKKALYIGVTNNLAKRIYEHKNEMVEGFSEKYKAKYLVYYEITNDIETAIKREKQLKNWRREKKEMLICKMNPRWKDLYQETI